MSPIYKKLESINKMVRSDGGWQKSILILRKDQNLMEIVFIALREVNMTWLDSLLIG